MKHSPKLIHTHRMKPKDPAPLGAYSLRCFGGNCLGSYRYWPGGPYLFFQPPKGASLTSACSCFLKGLSGRVRGVAEQVPAVCDVLDAIELCRWERLAGLLHPEIHWTTAAEEDLAAGGSGRAALARSAAGPAFLRRGSRGVDVPLDRLPRLTGAQRLTCSSSPKAPSGTSIAGSCPSLLRCSMRTWMCS